CPGRLWRSWPSLRIASRLHAPGSSSFRAHWLDRESANALGFVARRLDADAIGMVPAVRDPAPSYRGFEGLPELRLKGLGKPEAGELPGSVTGARLDQSV